MKTRIMYIEFKGGGLTGPARIGRVSFSATGKTLYYKGQSFQSLKGQGFKANYFDLKTGYAYWISGCKKAGGDTLYPGTIDIDEAVREEYWLTIRNLPDRVRDISFRTDGKYPKRKRK